MIVERDVVYAGGDRQLCWDIYRPDESEGKLPAVIVLHGGGWRVGSRSEMVDACAAFVRKGFVAIAAEYRLIGEVAWPEPLRDVEQCLVAAADRHEFLRIDPARIFLAGFSAGAHLSLLASASSGTVAGVAAFFPLVRVAQREAAMLEIVGEENWAAASPINHVHSLPPTIVFTGDRDEVVPWQDAWEFHGAMRAAGRVADFQMFSDLPHEFVRLPGLMARTAGSAAAFFSRTSMDDGSFAEANVGLHAWWRELLSTMPPAGAGEGHQSSSPGVP